MSMLRTIEELRVNGGKEVVAKPAEGKLQNAGKGYIARSPKETAREVH